MIEEKEINSLKPKNAKTIAPGSTGFKLIARISTLTSYIQYPPMDINQYIFHPKLKDYCHPSEL